MEYAIVQASGKQFWIEENKFYDFNKFYVKYSKIDGDYVEH